MTLILSIFILLLVGAITVLYFLKQRADQKTEAALQQALAARQQSDQAIENAQNEITSAMASMQRAYEQKIAELDLESERIREHYESEARKIQEVANKLLAELEPLRGYASLKDAETEVQKTLADAIKNATGLQQQAQLVLAQSRQSAAEERAQAQQRAKEIRDQADALLTQATRDAGRIVADAEKLAEQIGGDAYVALRDKQLLERAATAMRNIIEGYGDRYIIPSHSLLDELAVEFGYDSAGQALKSAREQSRRMVEQGEAATCDYVEANRKGIAIRFVIDAFNGRVDAILSRTRHDNYGTLEQEIRDAYNLVNFNGQAFRNAQILPTYLEARLAELKWAQIVNELANKQREEQRYLKERLRDEERARKEYEEKLRQAAKEEEFRRKAVEEAERKVANATAEQKVRYEEELQRLRQDLAEATEQKLTIAQQTKKGHVYIISNIGSFGENVYKIGQTRRPNPQDRVDELSVASVPFEFDVHAFIECENAPVLEHQIHKRLMASQVNKMNPRKEFFRVNLTDIRQEIDGLKQGEDFTVKIWTEMAVATQYKDSLEIENDPVKKEKWLARQSALVDRQLKIDTMQLDLPSVLETDEDQEEAV